MWFGWRRGAVRALGCVGDVLAQDWRAVGLGHQRVDQDRQFLVLDLDELDAVGGGITVGGHHEGDLLALEQHLAIGQDHLLVAGQRWHPVQVERFEILGGQNRQHAGMRQRGLGIDRCHAGMGIGRPDEIAEQHAWQVDIVDVIALALGEAHILDAAARGPEALELGGTFGLCRAHLVHCAASLAAFISAAAAMIALTMF